MNWSELDNQMMSRAIQLARKGFYTTRPNPSVGCVIVKDNQIIGEGYHQKPASPTPRCMHCAWLASLPVARPPMSP